MGSRRARMRVSIRHHLHMMAELSAWLGGQGLAAADLSPQVAGRFRGVPPRQGQLSGEGGVGGPLLAYLLSAGVLPSRSADDPADETGVLLRDYERYLCAERRLSEQTASQYLRYAAEFLAALGDPPDGAGISARLSGLAGGLASAGMVLSAGCTGAVIVLSGAWCDPGLQRAVTGVGGR
jgi:hypothetical protein